MRGDQLARQWRILRTIESKNHGTTVAELASQEDCSPRTIWRDLAAIQEAGFPPGPWNKSLSNLHKHRCCSYACHSTRQDARLIVPLVLYPETSGPKSRYGFVEGYKFQLPVPFTVTELMSLYFYRDILRKVELPLSVDAGHIDRKDSNRLIGDLTVYLGTRNSKQGWFLPARRVRPPFCRQVVGKIVRVCLCGSVAKDGSLIMTMMDVFPSGWL